MNPLFAPCFSDDLRAVDALLKLGADPHRPFLFFDATMQASLSQVAATIRMAPRVIQALRDAEAQPSDDAAPSAPLPQMEIKCRACGTKQGRFRKCSRCKAAHYCSVECQKYDWQFHKRTCKPCVAPAVCRRRFLLAWRRGGFDKLVVFFEFRAVPRPLGSSRPA